MHAKVHRKVRESREPSRGPTPRCQNSQHDRDMIGRSFTALTYQVTVNKMGVRGRVRAGDRGALDPWFTGSFLTGQMDLATVAVEWYVMFAASRTFLLVDVSMMHSGLARRAVPWLSHLRGR